MKRGVTQGKPVSPTIFNIVLDAVVQAVLLEVCGPQEVYHSFRRAAGEHNIVFYADDVEIAGRNPIWVHTTLTAMVHMFKRLGLQKNLRKTKKWYAHWGLFGANMGQQCTRGD